MLSEKQFLLKSKQSLKNRGISRVCALCEVVKFQKLSKGNLIIEIQLDGDPRMKTFNGYNHVLWRLQEARVLRQIDGALML
ncbi:conserved hypothetical protein [Aspergillus udagawae]|uniref:Uncharacterized protein n=1 Tax=Aspergillus udagawae TaxID=91492 RepID=A0A8H3XRB7_9EURO|nr:conserved hypothetical protein [Aspergillus udagawae]